MLEIARDLRLEHEPRSLVLTPGVLRLDLLDGHVALQLAVSRQPDLPDSASRMLADQLETLAPDVRRMPSQRTTADEPLLRDASSRGRVSSPPSDAPSVVRSASSLISVSTSWVSSKAFHASRLRRKSFWCAFK